MEHYTCDKCGMPMEFKRTMDINGRRYEICQPCEDKIMKELEEKGEYILTTRQEEIRRKFYRDEYWST